MLPWKLRTIAMAMLAAGAPSAHALCTLVCGCAITTTNAVFGTYNPLAFGSLDTTATVNVTCGGVLGLLIPYELRLGAGSGTFDQRTMMMGARSINYNLYSDPAYTSVFGDGSGGTTFFSGNFPLALLGAGSVLHTIYARIPGRQLSISPGAYTDSLQVTLIYF